MPGTIQVSVLDFKGLSSSSPPLSLFIKVSMGKREYHTWDKGDFSFPLTTLRDNLIVTLADAEGNQISHTGVQTMLIVEKGLWEDTFPLKGGGHVHMKLQFILSEEERNRIRTMRESALKKKHGASTVGGFESSVSVNHEVSDSQTSVVHNEAVSAGDAAVRPGPLSPPDNFLKDSQSSNGTKEGTHMQITPNATDRSEEISSAPLSQGVEEHQTEVHHRPLVEKIETTKPIFYEEVPSTLERSEPVVAAKDESVSPRQEDDPVDKPKNARKLNDSTSSTPISQGIEVHDRALVNKIETQLLHADVTTRPTLLQEASYMLGFSKSVIASKSKSVTPKLEDDVADNPEKQGPLEKTPSNVRKMISAFESSLSQDRRPPIKPLAAKSQSNRVGIEGPLEGQDSINVTKPRESSSGWLKNPFLIGDLQQAPTEILKAGEHIDFTKDLDGTKPSEATKQLLESSAIHIKSTGTDASIKNKFKEARKEIDTKERAKSPKDSCGTSVIKERSREIMSSDSHEISIQGAANDNLKSEAHCEDKHNSYESSGAWLFPGDMRHLCITTGGKEVMDLLGGSHQGNKSSSVPGNVGEHRIQCGSNSEMRRGEKKPQKLRKSRTGSSGDDASTGLVGKAIKIAIVVGFGILVLLTRQREPRKINRKEEDPFFITPDFIDQESLSEE